MKKTSLLLIDTQNDFCDPQGALYVQGAREDSLRLAEFIDANAAHIDRIYVTLDTHHFCDIAHPVYWQNSGGDHPEPFTIITLDDVKSGKWQTSRLEDRDRGVQYVQDLSDRGRYQLCIWPPHCLIGSWGTQLQSDIFQALSRWEERHIRGIVPLYKGLNSTTEHYGAFEAEVPREDDPLTQLRTDILEELIVSDRIIIAGQALDYCVANTVHQLAGEMSPGKLKNIVLLVDCCSPVDASSGISGAFLEEMAEREVSLKRTADYRVE